MNKIFEIAEAALAIAYEAGAAILKVYDGEDDFGVTAKDDNSPLTTADLAAHDIIVDGLSKIDPSYPVLSEESKSVDYDERKRWNRYWLVDPLDGTKEFIKRNGEFTVNIAFIEDGEPIAGVVVAPVLSTAYIAVKGSGAFKEERGQKRKEIRAKEWTTGVLKVVASKSHITPELEEFLSKIEIPFERTSMGSSLKLCMVAEGEAHIYPRLGPTMEWDTAAAHCVAESAGAKVTNVNGEPLRYNKENLLNPFFIVSATDTDVISGQ